MKSRKAQIYSRSHKIPNLKFKSNGLTSFGGLVVFMALFQSLLFRNRLKACFDHLGATHYGFHTIMMILIVHKIIGFRRLRELDCYRDDPLVKHVLGLRKFPDVATISRHLAQMDRQSFEKTLDLNKELVFERMVKEELTTVTLDLDGSVTWTTGCCMEGTAVGFNKAKKGARGYYPLFCTVSQTSQVLDMLHRPGNVHDSNGAAIFALTNICQVRKRLPNARIESRSDSAFFSEKYLGVLDASKVEFTVSVPFERFTELKKKIEDRHRWRRIDHRWSYFEDNKWQPEKWEDTYNYRFIFIRQRVRLQRKGPIQLDLFVLTDEKYEYKVIVTNKRTSARNILLFHNGRGSQEGTLGELKSDVGIGYLPCRKLVANQHYMVAAILAHTLTRELQMVTTHRHQGLGYKRPAMWTFKKLSTIRNVILRRAGRICRPGGELTIVMNENATVKQGMTTYLNKIAA